jgi:plastocyanin
MKLRAFAAAWTVFTALAAPALLLAQEAPPEQPPSHEPPAAEPAPEPDPPAEAKPKSEPVKPAPQDEPGPPPQASQPSAPAPQGEPAPQPAAPAADQQPAGRPAPVARVAASASVTIKDYSFSPSSVTVNVGDTVTWTNAGPTAHTATGSGFDTGLLDKGESGSHTFNEAGTFSYICTPHPYMKASVTVVGGGSETDGGNSGSGGATGQDDGSGDSATESTGDSADEASLPNSGAEAWALALIGTGLLALGVSLRGRTT